MRKLILDVIIAGSVLAATAVPALAHAPTPLPNTNGCVGTEVAFSTPAQGVANMPEAVSTHLWSDYIAAGCNPSPDAWPGANP